MISKLAEEMYAESVGLKRFNKNNLMFKSKRLELLNELNEIQRMVCSVQQHIVTEGQYSSEHIALAVFMKETLCECMTLLVSKDKNYRKTVHGYLWGFHNLPRAFFHDDNSLKISPEEALIYFRCHLRSV